MKKLIIVLMMVAMASFLFVGCLPGTTTPTTTTTTTTTPTVAATVAPIIIAVDAGALVNKAEAANGIIVNGTGRTYSEIKLSIDGVLVSSGDVEVDGTWVVVIAKTELGADGAKVLTATATEPGFAESAKSNEVKFTLDIVLPSIKSSSAKDGTAGALRLYSFTETADSSTPAVAEENAGTFQENLVNPTGTLDLAGGEWWTITVGVDDIGEEIIGPFTELPVVGAQLEEGTINWKIDMLSVTAINDIARVYNLTAGTFLDFEYPTGTAPLLLIPGLEITIAGAAAGDYCLITTTNEAAVAAVPGYIDVTFDAPVTGASILALTSTWNVQSPLAAAVANNPSVLSTTVARIFEAVGGTLVAGNVYLISCDGIEDLAGNAILDTAPSSDYGIVLP